VVPGGGGGGGPEEVGTEQGGDGGGDGVLLTGCRGDDIRGWAAAWVADGGGALRAALIPFAGQRAGVGHPGRWPRACAHINWCIMNVSASNLFYPSG
jgi:hypothetical protein